MENIKPSIAKQNVSSLIISDDQNHSKKRAGKETCITNENASIDKHSSRNSDENANKNANKHKNKNKNKTKNKNANTTIETNTNKLEKTVKSLPIIPSSEQKNSSQDALNDLYLFSVRFIAQKYYFQLKEEAENDYKLQLQIQNVNSNTTTNNNNNDSNLQSHKNQQLSLKSNSSSNSNSNSSSQTNLHSNMQSRSHYHLHLSSISEKFWATLDLSSEKNSSGTKFPKEFIKVFPQKLKEITLKKDIRYSDPNIRRSFSAFYAQCLDEKFMKQIKESRKIEDLIMLFSACANRELKISKKDDNVTDATDYQVSFFVRFISDSLISSGLAGSSSAIIKTLKSYESNLITKKTLTPNSRPFLSPLDSNKINNNSQTDNKKYKNLNTLTTVNSHSKEQIHNLKQIKLGPIESIQYSQEVSTIFHRPLSEIERDISRIWSTDIDAKYLDDLKKYLSTITQNSIDSYSPNDFDQSLYKEWSLTESNYIKSLIISLFTESSSLNSASNSLTKVDSYDNSLLEMNTSSSKSIELSSKSLYFIPPQKRMCLWNLIHETMLLSVSYRKSESDINEDFLSHNQNLLSFLIDIFEFWRIFPYTFSAALLNVAAQLFSLKKLNLFELKRVFTVFYDYSENDKSKGSFYELQPLSDRKLITNSLIKLHNSLVLSFCDYLETILLDPTLTIGSFIEIFNEYIYTNTLFSLTEEDALSRNHKIESALKNAAEKKYDSLLVDTPRDSTLDPSHVTSLGSIILTLVQKLAIKYKRKIFDEISVSKITSIRLLKLYLNDMTSMVDFIQKQYKKEGKVMAFNDFKQIFGYYQDSKAVLLTLNPKVTMKFNYEEKQYKYVLEWIDRLCENKEAWINNTVNSDNFTMGEDPMRASSSVKDLFGFINSMIQLIKSLHWEDEYHNALFYQRLMKTISTLICLYCFRLDADFNKELEKGDTTEESTNDTSSDAWMQRAKRAITGKTPLKPFQFNSQTCVKLNDIRYAAELLDSIEHQMDSELLSDLIATSEKDDNQSQNNVDTFDFSLKFIRAEDIKADSQNNPCACVTLSDQTSRKLLFKSRIAYESTEPMWNETTDVTITSSKRLRVTIWNESYGGNHEVCGRTFIDLNPQSFSDFISREIWLDLDTQGRLLVKIGMESESDNIMFLFGKSFRRIRRTENDMIQKIIGKFSAFIHYSLSHHRIKHLFSSTHFDKMANWISNSSSNRKALTTGEIEDALNPLFDYLNANFRTLSETLSEPLKIKVMKKTWKVVLNTLEGLLLPPLSDKKTAQKPLTPKEVEVVFTWLSVLKDFFHNDGHGPPIEELTTDQYQELLAIPVYYDMPTEYLETEIEKLSPNVPSGGFKNRRFLSIANRRKTILGNRNMKTIKRHLEENRLAKSSIAPNEDIILRILRLRNSHNFLSRRLMQRDKLMQRLIADKLIQSAKK